MNVELIYHTPNYHRLVETVARVCYQSYHKDDVNSHNFIKAIMAKGHISIASVGNMVFKVNKGDSVDSDFVELSALLMDLITMHEVTPFIKWSIPDAKVNNSDLILISMNMLTFLDIYEEREKRQWISELLDLLIEAVGDVPHLRWFYDKSVELPESSNEYTALGIPNLYEPIVLDEDYTRLKELGLNDYELGIHATITMNFITDRSASLQFWRHWSGGCELSQRYVERGNAEFRIPSLEDEELSDYLELTTNQLLDAYTSVLDGCEEIGIRKGRAKEIARSILPNAITTQLIQSRPYRNWMHLFKLRDSKHAQREIQEDVIHIKRVLNGVGVPTELEGN